MIKVLSTSRNFTIRRLAYKRNRDNNVPFAFDFIEQFIEHGVTATPSIPIVFAQLYFVTPPGEPFDQLEKMFMMFEVEAWLAIFFTFSVALCTILISLMSQSMKNLIYGSNLTSPGHELDLNVSDRRSTSSASEQFCAISPHALHHIQLDH